MPCGKRASYQLGWQLIAFLYGLAAYATSVIALLYIIGFVSNLIVPKTIDSGAEVLLPEAVIVDFVLIALFAIQNIFMARKKFKKWWTQFVP